MIRKCAFCNVPLVPLLGDPQDRYVCSLCGATYAPPKERPAGGQPMFTYATTSSTSSVADEEFRARFKTLYDSFIADTLFGSPPLRNAPVPENAEARKRRDKVAKIRRLRDGAATDGERAAAQAALDRMEAE